MPKWLLSEVWLSLPDHNCSDFVRVLDANSHRHTRESGYLQGEGVPLINSEHSLPDP